MLHANLEALYFQYLTFQHCVISDFTKGKTEMFFSLHFNEMEIYFYSTVGQRRISLSTAFVSKCVCVGLQSTLTQGAILTCAGTDRPLHSGSSSSSAGGGGRQPAQLAGTAACAGPATESVAHMPYGMLVTVLVWCRLGWPPQRCIFWPALIGMAAPLSVRSIVCLVVVVCFVFVY